MDRLDNLMKDLCETNGISGFEREVRNKLEQYLAPLADEILKDRMGGIVAKKTGEADGPRILLAGHLDEIGFMVTQITDKGFLRFQPIGGWWAHNVLSHRVTVQSRKGSYLGIIGSKSLHALEKDERNRLLDLKEMFIDIGARSREEVEEMGIRLGDPVVPVSDFTTLRNGEWWCGKALDNRAGCALGIEVLRQLNEEHHPNTVYVGATVQEEVGLRGAGALAKLVQPDIAFALDVGLAYDTPGFESLPGQADLEEGPMMFLLDHFMIGHGKLRDLVLDTAEELGIHVQLDALMGGGTDGGKFHLHGLGCPTVAIGFPTRYVHSHNTIMARRDFEEALRLVTAVVKKLDQAQLDEIIL